MRSGQLHHKITIRTFDDHALDDYGVATPSWSDVATVRAELLQQTAKEFLASQGASETISLVFKTRFVRDVSNADQILFEGKEYNIKEVAIIGRNRGLELRAEEVQS